jgi:hypothetical protein
VRVHPVTHDDLRALLALIGEYQRFYGNTAVDDEHNAEFFGRFVSGGDRGRLIAAYDDDGTPVGYTCLYWTYSSV